MPKKTQAKLSSKRPTVSRAKAQRRVSGRTPGGSVQSDPDMQAFGRAIELFNAGRFQAAKDALAKLVSAANRDLGYSAELRMKMCDQRLTRAKRA